LLAFTRRALSRIGRFDTGYRLYFEETDWLARARAAKLPTSYVPEAVAVHLYDQSAKAESASSSWFGQSAARYRRRHYGLLFERLLAWVEKPVESPAHRLSARQLVAPVGSGDRPWIELSPRRLGFPAVAERAVAGRAWRLPRSLATWHPGASFWGRWVSDEGRELGPPFLITVDEADCRQAQVLSPS
jgi:GT2 family glycosyltransferase